MQQSGRRASTGSPPPMTPHYADALMQRYMRSSMAAGADSSESPGSSVTKSRVSPHLASRNTQFGQRASNIIQAAAFDSDDGDDFSPKRAGPSGPGAAGRTSAAAAKQPAQAARFSGRVSSSSPHGRRSAAATFKEAKAAAPGAARRVSSPAAAAAAGLQRSRVSTAQGSSANSKGARPPARSLALELPRGWEAAPLGGSSNRSTGSSPEPAGRMQPQHSQHESIDNDKRGKLPSLAGWQQASEAAQHLPGRSSSASSGRMLSPTPPQQQPPGSLSPRSSAMLVLQQRMQQQQQQKRAASQDLHELGSQQQQQHAADRMQRDDVVALQLREITQSAAAAIARARGTSAMAAGVLQQTAAGPGGHRASTGARGSRPSAGERPDGGFNRPASPSLPPPNVALAREAARRVSSPPAGSAGAHGSPSRVSRAQDHTDSGSDDDAGLRGLPGYGDGTRATQRRSGVQAQRHQEQAAAAAGEHTGLGWEQELEYEQQQQAHPGLAGVGEGELSTGLRGSSASPGSWQQGSRRLSATGEATAAALSAAAATARRRSSMHEGGASPTDLAAAAVSRKASQALAAAAAVGVATGSVGQAGGGSSSNGSTSSGCEGSGRQGSGGPGHAHR
jgi:hypothetical protein